MVADANRFVNSKGKFGNDEQWVSETASSIFMLMSVLARKEVAINVLGLLRLLATGSTGKINVKRKFYLDLVG